MDIFWEDMQRFHKRELLKGMAIGAVMATIAIGALLVMITSRMTDVIVQLAT